MYATCVMNGFVRRPQNMDLSATMAGIESSGYR